ncbi:hypothetical protein FRC12_006946 [Ceratobasidium sp. 428]|nr:hypothetical protein FRC12_006946 [Ceratobasidium sp. 428]
MPPWNFVSMNKEEGAISTFFHFLFQGVLITLLPNALSSGQKDPWQTRAYVLSVNTLALAQTVISGFNVLDDYRQDKLSLVVPPTLTALLAMVVQSFYILRCWRMLGRRWLCIVPYLVLWLAAAGSGFAIAGLLLPSIYTKDIADQQKITLGIWGFSSFAIDLLMTCTTVVYIFQSHKGTSGAHDGVFTTVWNVIWSAAVPPLVVMFAVMVAGYMIPSTADHSWATFFADLSGKVYALSLMITLAGRGYVRKKFSDVNVGRACSGESAVRRTAYSIDVFRHPTSHEHDEGATQGSVPIQLNNLNHIKTPANKAANQNESDCEFDESQRSKADAYKLRISGEV